MVHTLQGLFNSNPRGASGLSVWPLRNPVNLKSRSITSSTVNSANPYNILVGAYFAA